MKRRPPTFIGILVLLLVAGFTSPAAAEMLLDTGVPAGYPAASGIGAYSNSVITQPFTLGVDAKNLSIRPRVNLFGSANPVRLFLSRRVGPGTTQADVIATTLTTNAASSQFTTMMILPALPSGNYYLTMAPGSFGNPMFNSLGWDFRPLGQQNVGTFGVHGYGNANTAFPPATAFTFNPSYPRLHLMQVVGDEIVYAPASPGGGGLDFYLDVGDVLITGDGEGTSTVTKTDLGGIHGLQAQSVAGSPIQSKTNNYERIFTYSREDGGSDPGQVYVYGYLDGLLAADNLSTARVNTNLSIFEVAGNELGTDRLFYQVDPLLGMQEEISVNEYFGFSALLTPGEQYRVVSNISVFASSSLGGAARALFAETMEFVLSGSPQNPIPEPSTLLLLCIGAVGLLIRFRFRGFRGH